MVDTISDILTRIRNASLIKSDIVVIPLTRISHELSVILQNEGFIESFKIINFGFPRPSNPLSEEKTPLENDKPRPGSPTSKVLIYLKYHSRDKKPCLTNLKRISKPGLRIYSTSKDLPKILGGIGIAILSTSQGIMTDREARFRKIGGEVLCAIW